MRLALLLVALCFGCHYVTREGGNVVTGWITPDYFVFQEIVPLTDAEPGGWRATCIRATMRDGDTGMKVACQFEVGIPIKTQAEGWINVNLAREIAAQTANEAAYTVLSRRGAGVMLGPACIEFINILRVAMPERLPQSRARSECDPRLEPVVFDLLQ
jgi:hypothetical protein